MDACKVCAQLFDDSERTVLCSGICGKLFHPGCAGLNVTNLKAWTANVGLLWFCVVCRLNFNPVITDRETVIMKAMRDMLIRMDSIDLRIGQYGENLKILNSLLTINPTVRRESTLSTRIRQHLNSGTPLPKPAEFCTSIDRVNFDSSLLSNPANNTIFDDDDLLHTATIANVHHTTSASFSEINTNAVSTASALNTTTTATTIAASATNTATATTTTIAAAAAAAAVTARSTAETVASTAPRIAATTQAATTSSAAPVNTTRIAPPVVSHSNDPNVCRLKVVNKSQNLRVSNARNDASLKSFYITPFHNEQSEDDIMEYLHETINADADKIKCVKLVPKGKSVNDLTFVSFKLSVSTELAPLVGDAFYWPDGVEVREFLPKNDKSPLNVRPPIEIL